MRIHNSNMQYLAEFRLKNKFNFDTMYKNLRYNISDPIRERYWLIRLLELNMWPAILICGEKHVSEMRKLIRKVSNKTVVTTYLLFDYAE